MSKLLENLAKVQGAAIKAANSPQMAPVWGFLNQGRMEVAHYLGKAFPDQPQHDDPAAAFNRTGIEGYKLKHGIEMDRVREQEMDR